MFFLHYDRNLYQSAEDFQKFFDDNCYSKLNIFYSQNHELPRPEGRGF